MPSGADADITCSKLRVNNKVLMQDVSTSNDELIYNCFTKPLTPWGNQARHTRNTNSWRMERGARSADRQVARERFVFIGFAIDLSTF